MKKKTRFLLHILFIALTLAAVMGIGSFGDNVYAAVNDKADGVYFAEDYAVSGGALTVKYDAAGAPVEYKWFINDEQTDCTADNLVIKDSHYEKMIRAEVWSGGKKLGDAEMFCSKLPVMYLDTEGGQPVVTKDDYIDAEIHLQGNDLYNTGNTTLYTGATEIKGRGNSTWKLFDKKPYKLKLDKKTSLFASILENVHYTL